MDSITGLTSSQIFAVVSNRMGSCFRAMMVVKKIAFCLVLLMLANRVSAEDSTFAGQVLPIFKQHCLTCHGPEKQESNYRLDIRDSALGVGDRDEPPIIASDAINSPLFQLVIGKHADEIVMPPEGVRLDKNEVRILRAWIDAGAHWPDELAGNANARLTTKHWSFQPIQRPDPPDSKELWIRNEIDAFVLRQLKKKNLTPSKQADRRTLIRRLYLDMLGLPPTPAQVTRFIHDDRDDAYDRLVAQVLSSQHYGERWAQHWLDVVRFGESDGFETNHERPNAYRYRDYVIGAFNSDKPYNDFIREQLAGDAMNADVATGFLVAGPCDIVKSPDVTLTLTQRQDELADIVNTTATAFLGMTVGCARCHNHKFDPILQRDFYALQAVFAGVQFGERTVPSEDARSTQEEMDRLATEKEVLEAKLDQYRTQANLQTAADSADLRSAVNALRNVDEFDPVRTSRIRFEILATNGGEPCIDELEVLDTSAECVNVALGTNGAVATASGTLPGHAIHKLEHINDGKFGNSHSWISDTPGSGWVQIDFPQPVKIDRVVWGRSREGGHADRIATRYVIEVASGDEWKLVANSDDRLPFASSVDDAFVNQLPAAVADEARAVIAEAAALQKRIDALADSLPKAYAGTFSQPGKTYRLYRGDPLAPREEVVPDAMSVISSLQLDASTPEQQRRVALADWITSPDNPLTARVAVNRVWHYHFGSGLVATPSDFGANGSKPSHPQLLDWLASEFVDRGWSLKKLHRLIVTSATYRQGSSPRANAIAVDAGTRLLWRFPPRRLEAEAIRDCILHVTGSLDATIGGPGFSGFEVISENVRHYFPKKVYGPADWRRMIYMTKIRREQDSVFGVFDCPDGGQVAPNRTRSTTPLQALNLMNSQFMLQQAEALASQLQREAGDNTGSQVIKCFQRLYGRDPDVDELSDATSFAHEQGMESVCRALLNSNEFLFLE